MHTSASPTTALIHIAGPVMHIGQQVRQRCMWCGACLIDYDLDRVMVPIPADGSPPPELATWEVGALIGVDGEAPKVTWVEADAETTWGQQEKQALPDACCTRLDSTVTG